MRKDIIGLMIMRVKKNRLVGCGVWLVERSLLTVLLNNTMLISVNDVCILLKDII
jgi:hypothetical protein